LSLATQSRRLIPLLVERSPLRKFYTPTLDLLQHYM